MKATKKALFGILTVLTLLAGAQVAGATVITSLAGGTVVSMPDNGYGGFTNGPEVFFGPGISVTWSSDNNPDQNWGYTSVFGYRGGYGFASNGYWSGALGPMAGTNDTASTMTFSFQTPVAGVGGFINYAPGYGAPAIAAYDAAGNLLESTGLDFQTAGYYDSGFFFGFLQSDNVIKSFSLSNAYIGLTNLTFLAVEGGDVDQRPRPVPEPGTMVLLGAGLVGLAVARRKRQ